ncbi:GNAT family N-acetyltransferase [Gallibacterium genomosp. 1]|uniref:Acetyltransferase n=1 Tax=Gallibacterium genomosp. 1 TaxID=155515 RepID=A0A0A2YNP6_9PAST|nr:GNAT family N-acetyltransferase [Gallibacterium genomosp. 1]KGQ38959.1 acetyltransferase [Gallibacterium genomosp. 1]
MQQQVRTFNQLTTRELFQIYQARTAVFVVEQQCSYQEVDEIDLCAFHLWLSEQQHLVAYTRIFFQNEYVHFGRVLVMPDFRGKSYAQTLLRSTLAFIQQQFPNYLIEIQAQHYLQEFYQKFGFVVVSDIYLEDNIPHIDMRKF